MTTSTTTITAAEMLAEVRREIALRKAVFPQRVAARKMRQADADRSLARMQAVHDLLDRLCRTEGQAIIGDREAAIVMVRLGLHEAPDE